MKQLIIGIGLALSMSLFSCTTQEQPKEQKNPLIFSTNFDNLQGWDKDNEKFQKENSKSGIWGTFVNATSHFSYGLDLPFKSIPSNEIKNVKVSFWAKKAGKNDKSSLCLDIRDVNKKSLAWQTFKLKDAILENNKWFKVETTFDIAKIKKNDAKVALFVWNSEPDSTSQLYIDDFTVEFLEKAPKKK